MELIRPPFIDGTELKIVLDCINEQHCFSVLLELWEEGR